MCGITSTEGTRVDPGSVVCEIRERQGICHEDRHKDC
jgi:hypothetical protein